MIVQLIHSFQSEWLKTRRSLASWMVILGGIFIPLILCVARIVHHKRLPSDVQNPEFWETIFSNCWQAMLIFLLPMGIVLAASLITQLEFRNNSWKQLHTTPQPLTIIFIAKLSVVLVMLLQLFILFDICTYFAGIIPPLIYGIEIPKQSFPFWHFLQKSYYFFLACLPIVAFQYLISLQFKNFLVPLGLGLGFQVASLIAVEWKYGYMIPYTYCPYSFFMLKGGQGMIPSGVNIHNWAIGYFVFLTAVSYVLYITKKEKG
jgi:hypothetical protein